MPSGHQFGVFEFNLGAHELRKHGTRIRLIGQPFEILALLLERPGEIVTRDQLRERLWPADTFVDFEHSLNTAIKKLRSALGDSPENSRYIETVPRVGYRFIAPVQAPGPPSPTPADVSAHAAGSLDAPVPAAGARRSGAARLALGSGVLLAGMMAAVWWGAHLIRQHSSPSRIRSLAVLPLEDLSHDPAQDYFAEAMTDELITSLAKIRELRVISRTSVMKYRGTSKGIEEIARELNVDAVVEGTILRAGSEVHITAQLVQALPEKHLWAESYSRPLGDLMAVEGEVVREIAGAVRLTLTPDEQARLSSAHKVPPEAFQAYLQGRFFWNKRSPEGLVRSIEFFEQAIDKDPLYAGAYAGLADAYALRGGYFSIPQSEAIFRARAAARKALEIDPSLAEAHASLALIAGNYDWNWTEAEREYRRAIELNPNYATAHHWYGEAFLVLMGRFDEALAEMNRAQELDPLSTIIRVDTGVVYYMARQNDAAIAQYRRALELEPNYPLAHVWLSRAYAGKGMLREAIQELEPQRQSDSSLVSLSDLGRLYGQAGRREDALRVLQELRERSANEHLDPALVINVYVGLGAKDQVFAWFEKAHAEHSTALTPLKVLPLYDPVRSDPRFANFMRSVHLAQ
jgi:TolB-like protein/DNA-binding winged helix-turn-helix (wHTH) protein/Tfp pilus assembly protein PilF